MECCCHDKRSFKGDKVKIFLQKRAFESIPAGKWKVEAGAGGYISRAVQWTVSC